MSMVPGEEYTVSSVATSFSSAVASVTILKVEPGAYSAPVARFTSELSSAALPDAAAASSDSTSAAL